MPFRRIFMTIFLLEAKRRSKIESFYHGNAFDQTYTQHNLHGLLSKQQFFTFKLLMAELRPVTGPLLMQKWPLFQSQTIGFFLIRWLCLNKNRLLEIRADADELKKQQYIRQEKWRNKLFAAAKGR